MEINYGYYTFTIFVVIWRCFLYMMPWGHTESWRHHSGGCSVNQKYKVLKVKHWKCMNKQLFSKRSFGCLITYSYILNVIAVTQVEMAYEVAAVVLWITMWQNNTHRTNLEGAREQKTECFECVEQHYDIWAKNVFK